jgi:hypothetical protein
LFTSTSNVGDHDDRVVRQSAGDFLQGFPHTSDQDDPSTGGGERGGHRGSDPSAGPGDDRILPG